MITRYRQDGARRVAANSWQRPGNRKIFGKLRIVILYDLLCCAVKITGTSIVSQAFPQAQDFIFFRGGEAGNVRESFDESLEEWNHGHHLRLLQHDFAYPDVVQGPRTAPRQVAAVCPEPGEQASAQ